MGTPHAMGTMASAHGLLRPIPVDSGSDPLARHDLDAYAQALDNALRGAA